MENVNTKFSLLIDGCLDYLEIAVIINNKIIDSYFEIQNKNLTKIFIPTIKNIIEKNYFTRENIEKIFTINGPGSFTSIKSVVLFANTFKIVFPRTELLYLNSVQWNITKPQELVLIDAKTDLFYVGKNHLQKPFLITKTELDKLKTNFDIYLYTLNNKKSLLSKWNFNQSNFLLSNFIRPLYVKKPVYDYHKK